MRTASVQRCHWNCCTHVSSDDKSAWKLIRTRLVLVGPRGFVPDVLNAQSVDLGIDRRLHASASHGLAHVSAACSRHTTAAIQDDRPNKGRRCHTAGTMFSDHSRVAGPVTCLDEIARSTVVSCVSTTAGWLQRPTLITDNLAKPAPAVAPGSRGKLL